MRRPGEPDALVAPPDAEEPAARSRLRQPGRRLPLRLAAVGLGLALGLVAGEALLRLLELSRRHDEAARIRRWWRSVASPRRS